MKFNNHFLRPRYISFGIYYWHYEKCPLKTRAVEDWVEIEKCKS